MPRKATRIKYRPNYRKKAIRYYLNEDNRKITEELMKELPISLKYNEELIDRIYIRYPFISKAEIAIVVREIFNEMRNQLIIGNNMNFRKLFTSFEMFISKKKNSAVIKPRILVPKEIRDEQRF